MTWVVAYDISNDRTRAATATLLQQYGVRVQESVFECRLDRPMLREMTRRLGEQITLEGTDGIVLYRVCKDCSGASLRIGQSPLSRWHVS